MLSVLYALWIKYSQSLLLRADLSYYLSLVLDIFSFIILQLCRKETVPPKYFICSWFRIVQSFTLVKHFYLKLLFSGAVAEEDGATFKRQLDRTTFAEF